MTENMRKLLELASANAELAEKLNAAGREESVAIAKELGVELAETDFEQTNELSDDELDAVAGGGKCICALGGGGTAESGESKTCACVIGGGGEDVKGNCRCTCVAYGVGDPVSVYS